MKHKVRYEVGETILITLIFIFIPKFVISHPIEELRDETLRQRQAILEPQSLVDYIDGDSVEFGYDTSVPKRAVGTTTSATTAIIEVTISKKAASTTLFPTTKKAESQEPQTSKPHLKKRDEGNFRCYFVGNIGVISHCIRYLACTKIGAMPKPQHCMTGQHFDLKMRLCVDKDKAECDSDKVCPDDQTEYSMDDGDLICKDGIPVPKNKTGIVEAPAPKPTNSNVTEGGDLSMIRRGLEDETKNLTNGDKEEVSNAKSGDGGYIADDRIANDGQNLKDSEGIINVVLTEKNSDVSLNGEANSKDFEKTEVTSSPIVEGIIIGIPKSKSVEKMNGTNGPLIEGYILGPGAEGTQGNEVRVSISEDDDEEGNDFSNNTSTENESSNRTTTELQDRPTSHEPIPHSDEPSINEINGVLNLTNNEGGEVQNSKRSTKVEKGSRTAREGASNKSTVINIMVAVSSGDGIGLPRPGTKLKTPPIVHVKVIQADDGSKKITGINETLAKQIGKQLTVVLEGINNNTQFQQSKQGKKIAQLEAKLKDGKVKGGQKGGSASNSSVVGAGQNKTSTLSIVPGNKAGAGVGGGGLTAAQQQEMEIMLKDKSKGQVSEVEVIKMEDGKEKKTKINEAVINQVGVQILAAALNQRKQGSHVGVNPVMMMMMNRNYSSSEQTWHHGIPQEPKKFNNTNVKQPPPGSIGHHVRHSF